MLIVVELSSRVRLDELSINRNQFKTFNPSTQHKRGYKAYWDKKSGLLINTIKGEVFQINYIAAARDTHLCPGYYRNPKAFVRVDVPGTPPPPAVVLDCPGNPREAASQITFFARFSGDRSSRFIWTVSGGKIVEGQGTATMTMDAEGLAGQTIAVSVEVGDGYGHTTFATCQLQFLPSKQPITAARLPIGAQLQPMRPDLLLPKWWRDYNLAAHLFQ